LKEVLEILEKWDEAAIKKNLFETRKNIWSLFDLVGGVIKKNSKRAGRGIDWLGSLPKSPDVLKIIEAIGGTEKQDKQENLPGF